MGTNKEYYQAQVNKIITTGEYAPIIKIFGQNGEGDSKHININKDSAQVLIDWLQLIVDRDKPRVIDFTKVNRDINGNSRHVCHFLEFIKDNEFNLSIGEKYTLALKRAKQLGGKKFHNKKYGGGIVFQTTEPEKLSAEIIELVNSL